MRWYLARGDDRPLKWVGPTGRVGTRPPVTPPGRVGLFTVGQHTPPPGPANPRSTDTETGGLENNYIGEKITMAENEATVFVSLSLSKLNLLPTSASKILLNNCVHFLESDICII